MPRRPVESPLVKVLMRDRSGNAESVWCAVIDDARGLYRLASIPFLRDKPTFGDAITASADDEGTLTFRRVHAPGGFVAAMLEYMKASTFAPLVRWMKTEHGAITEGCIGPRGGEPGLVVVAIPSKVGVAKVIAAASKKFPGVWTPGDRPSAPTGETKKTQGDAKNAQGDAEVALHDAIARGDVATTKKAIASGAKLDRRIGKSENTALHVAAICTHRNAITIVRALIKAGAKLEARNAFKQTAAFLAARRGDIKMVDVLDRAGADLVARDERGATTLHGAATSGFAALTKKLLAAGVDPNDRKNRFKTTALHGAATRDRPDVAKLLLAAGAKTTTLNASGFTPLVSTAYYGSAKAARVLAPLATVADRQDALLHAASEGYLPIVKLLVAAGADPAFKSKRGNTALSLARKKKHKDVIAYLVARQG